MRISIVGAGPAGLYFAILMKRLNPSHDITVFERDGPDDTFGWGIVFSGRTFSYLRDSDEPSYAQITAACETWDTVNVVHRDELVAIRGNHFSGIARITFLKILQRRASDLGVDLRFHVNVTDIGALSPSDLLVGADGANSQVRQEYSKEFEPALDTRTNKYIWLGTPQRFSGLTLSFRDTEWGVFAAHAYRFGPSLSTFIVECSPQTWERAGFAGLSEADTCLRLQDVYRKDLNGAPLLTNNFVRWLNFVLVKNRRWYHDNVVLLGDALHTAHFSIGSGTKLALEDAIALAGAFAAESGETAAALATFERTRKPVVDEYQAAALESLRRFEDIAEDMALPPIPFAYRLMIRSGRIDHEKLRRRDPAFVDAYERAVGGP